MPKTLMITFVSLLYSTLGFASFGDIAPAAVFQGQLYQNEIWMKQSCQIKIEKTNLDQMTRVLSLWVKASHSKLMPDDSPNVRLKGTDHMLPGKNQWRFYSQGFNDSLFKHYRFKMIFSPQGQAREFINSLVLMHRKSQYRCTELQRIK